MEEKKKVILQHPIVIKQEDGSEKVYKEVFIGRIKNKHLRAFPKDLFEKKGKIPPDKIPGIISALCEIPQDVADEIDIEDVWKIVEGLEGFFPDSQKTGSTISG